MNPMRTIWVFALMATKDEWLAANAWCERFYDPRNNPFR